MAPVSIHSRVLRSVVKNYTEHLKRMNWSYVQLNDISDMERYFLQVKWSHKIQGAPSLRGRKVEEVGVSGEGILGNKGSHSDSIA